MIKNLSEVAAQLKELADVINSFKSEAVQLRIVELILAGNAAPDAPPVDDAKSQQSKRKQRPPAEKRRTEAKSGDEKSGGAKTSGRPGPKAMLEQLIGAGFFKTPRTNKDIMDHCSNKLAQRYQPGEIAVSLTRLTREDKLDREKNAENQYTYITK